RRGGVVSAESDQIVAQSLDLQVFVTAENIVRTAWIKRRHLRARLYLLRIFEPFNDPVRIEPHACHREIGRPALPRTVRRPSTLHVTAETVEIVLRCQ